MADEQRAKVSAGAILKAFFSILAALATLYGFHAYVKHMISEQLEDSGFVNKVASQVRPAIIFDEKGSILADQGGCQYVKTIDISLSSSGHPTQMIVRACNHLAHEPVVESLSAKA